MESDVMATRSPEEEARDPATDGERLTALAEDPRFAPLVAANPNTPSSLLFRLLPRFPRQVIENPVLPLLLIENPQFFKGHERELLPLVRVADVPAFVMSIMRISKDKLARDAVRFHVQCGGEAGADWEQHAQAAIRRRPYHIADKRKPRLQGREMVRRFCAVPDIPAWLLTALAAHGADPVRLAVAAHPGTPPELLDFLTKDAQRDVVRQVAEHPHAAPEFFFAHTSQWNPLHRIAAKHLKLSLQLMEDIVANEADYELRRSLAQNPHLPPHIVVRLVPDTNPLVRATVAQRDDLAEADIVQLAGDMDVGVREAVAANPCTPASILEQLASDESNDVRRKVAENAQTPAAILEQLARDTVIAVRRATIGNPQMPATLLDHLFKEEGDEYDNFIKNHPNGTDTLAQVATSQEEHNRICLRLACSPATPPEILRKLSAESNAAIRVAIVENPNTPTEILVYLAQYFEKDLFPNLARNPQTPPEILARMAQGKDYTVLAALAANPNVTPAIFALIGGEYKGNLVIKEESICFQICQHPYATDAVRRRVFSDMLRSLAPYHAWHQRVTVLSSPLVPSSVLAETAQSIDWLDRFAIARNPGADDATLRALAEADGNRFVRAAARAALSARSGDDNHLTGGSILARQDPALVLDALRRADVNEDLLAWAQAEDDGVVRDAVQDHIVLAGETGDDWESRARNRINRRPLQFTVKLRAKVEGTLYADLPGTPLWLIELFAAHSSQTMRVWAASHPEAPASLLAALAADKDQRVHLGVAANQATSAETLAHLAHDKSQDVREAVAGNIHTPPECLDHITLRSHYRIREAVAKNPATSAETLKRLAGDESLSVRAYVAENPNTPREILAAFVDTNERWIVRRVAANPNLTVEMIERLATHSDYEVRLGIVNNAATPPSIREQYAADTSFHVRRELAGDVHCPPRVLRRFLHDSEGAVRSSLGGNCATPRALLEHLACDREHYVRSRVSGNHKAPDGVLAQLANDKVSLVRKAVAQNPNTPPEILEELVHDKDIDVAEAAVFNEGRSPEQQVQAQITAHRQINLTFCQRFQASPAAVRDRVYTHMLTETYPPFDHWLNRALILATPLVPPAVLAVQSNSPDWIDRFVIARNPATPAETRRWLAANDGNRYVRAAARAGIEVGDE